MKQFYWLSTAILTISFALLFSTTLVNADEGRENPIEYLYKHKSAGETHSHDSPHCGVVRTVGSYHVELFLNTNDHDPGSHIELYLMESEEQSSKTIAAEEIRAYVQEQDSFHFEAITLTVEPLDGETIGNASHFVGTRGIIYANRDVSSL